LKQENHYKEDKILQLLCLEGSASSLPILSFAHAATFTVFQSVV